MTRRTRRATRQAESRSGEEENMKTMKEHAEQSSVPTVSWFLR